MKCECCHVNDSCVEIKQITDGSLHELHLCAECAAEKGLKSPEDLAGMLLEGDFFPFDTGLRDADRSGTHPASCPACHMQAADFRKTSRLGCGQCYDAFADLLMPMITTMQRSSLYKGKQPVHEALRNELGSLKTQLDAAVCGEAYEEAASLRDRIRVLEVADACLEDEDAGIQVGDLA